MALMQFREPNQVKWVGFRPGHQGRQVLDYDISIVDTTQLMYTVVEGTRLFITSYWLWSWSSAAGACGMLVKDGEGATKYYLYRAEDDGAFRASIIVALPYPIEIPPEYEIYGYSNSANLETMCGFSAWIEDV